MELIGISHFQGEKNNKSYDFHVGYFIDTTARPGLIGSRAVVATFANDINVSDLKIGNKYKVYTYNSNNNRVVANVVLPE